MIGNGERKCGWRPRVALIRGPFLTPWEFRYFAPLQNEFEIHVFASRHSGEAGDVEAVVHRLPCADESLRFLPLLQRLDTALRRRCQGAAFFLDGLEQALAGFDFVHTAETFLGFSLQAAEVKAHGAPFKLIVTHWENIPHAHQEFSRAGRVKQQVRDVADIFLPTTQLAARALEEEGVAGEKIHLVYPGVDLSRFHPADKDDTWLKLLGLAPENLIILFVGRLVPEKGAQDLLEAFPDLLSAYPQARLLIVGEGPEIHALKEKVSRRRLASAVRFIPRVQHSDMPSIHNLADVFCLPSRPTPKWQEQFGMALAESMACGKPVVTTRTGSIPEVVGETGLLVEPGDVSSLCEALSRLLQSAKLRRNLGEAARRRVEERFDATKTSQNIRAAYQSLLHGEQSR